LREGSQFEPRALAETLYATLPVYAVPLFIRLVESLETTTTFKSRKVELRNQGYAADVSDPLYVLDGREEGYVPFYESYAADVAAGRRPH
jgi:fatty-acyl-CoA synthase